MAVAIVHDYLTQMGGAERVVLSMAAAFPGAPIYTSLYEPTATFPEFGDLDVRVSPLNRVAAFRRHHRLALPFLAEAFLAMRTDADVVLCSSSGWAHGVRTAGAKIVYCHNPPRWLHQPADFLGSDATWARRASLGALRLPLLAFDRRAARSADHYFTQSRTVRDRIRAVYGIEAELLPAPVAVDPDAPQEPIPGVDAGFFLSVSRLLPYKNVDVVIESFEGSSERLVIAGDGPERERLEAACPANVQILGSVTDAQIRWLYAHCRGLVAASFEDYGLTPIEALVFGRPTAALRAGGYLDTVIEGETGLFFDRPDATAIATAVKELAATDWDEGVLRTRAEQFSEAAFSHRLQAAVAEAMRHRQRT